MKEPQAAILAIGTELTNGQILNRNASWISQQLLQHGLDTRTHVSVPDDRAQIEQELERLGKSSQILFVTGGLGPTTDDFTRDCISGWSQKKLVWNEAAWEWITSRLNERQVVIREFQRQQCYFPEGSRVLHNPLGTAHAFYLKVNEVDVFILPGPPKEVEVVWRQHIDPWLKSHLAGLDRYIVKSWDCFGVGESDVAHRAETALEGCPFEKGYRAHLPFVEFKLFFKKSQQSDAEKYFPKVESALAPWVVARDGQDPVLELLNSFQNLKEIFVYDNLSDGYLWHRMSPGLKALELTQKLHFSHHADEKFQAPPAPHRLIVRLIERPDRQAQMDWNLNHKKQTLFTGSPYKPLLMREREKHFFAEKAILFWSSLSSLC